MSTPSIVAIRSKKGYEGIYVHCDGDSEYIKRNLSREFGTLAKAKKLIALGDMSGIADTYEDCKMESYYYKAFNCPGYEHMQEKIVNDENCFAARHFDSLHELHNYAKDNYCRLYIFENEVWAKEDKDGFLVAFQLRGADGEERARKPFSFTQKAHGEKKVEKILKIIKKTSKNY